MGSVCVGGDFDVRRGREGSRVRELNVWNRVEDTVFAAIAGLGPWYWGKARQHGACGATKGKRREVKTCAFPSQSRVVARRNRAI